MMNNCLQLFIIFVGVYSTSAYKPVILLHGVVSGSPTMELMKSRIELKHPGTIVFNVAKFADWASLENMWYQVQQIGQDIMNISNQHPEGIHFLGYSQGALLSRAILQAFPNHNVKNFISLSGPQAGQYGTSFLHVIFPGLVLESAFELFYSRVGQHTSVGNYWNDPYHQLLYYEYSQFLPYVNNDLNSSKSEQFKAGLTKLNKLVLIGGPDDNIITPWESSQFGYYENNTNDKVLTLMERTIYKDDLIGLRTLDGKGRLEIVTVPGMDHFMWHLNISFIDEYILKYFD